MLAHKSFYSLATFKTCAALFKLTEFHKKMLRTVPFENGITRKYQILDFLFPCNDQVNLSLPRAPSHQQKVTVFYQTHEHISYVNCSTYFCFTHEPVEQQN